MKMLGEKEVVLEFQSKEELESMLVDAYSFLRERVDYIKPCHDSLVGACWGLVKIFFVELGKPFGKHVCTDSTIENKERLEYVQILILGKILSSQFTSTIMNFNGNALIVVVE